MNLPSAALLEAWERGRDALPVTRALLLLACAEREFSHRELADLTIGQRDARLLALRGQMFGRRMEALASCAQCGETLEVVLDTEDLRAVAPPAKTQEQWRELPGRGVRVRPPTSADLLSIADVPSEDAARALMLRCVCAGVEWESTVAVAEIEAAVVAADPLAEVELALTCPACAHAWTAPLDIAGFLWEEVDAWAQRTLREVHMLARAYGWSEPEVLQLSPARRQLYLEMVGA